ncbi:Uncharacterised protein [Mycobacteroides abscessus subsp. abscessus]|nr:Uncharacterised protein [Mycobacteroides abscessus subsp. abscessus]SKH66472.1 Uncharacterised protein [Mycobacteroides abscessus subsp. abscessus]SKV45083.1 Uncharacterised protein [Mycobacteroides abscessus subsp. abscessus]
MRGVGASGTPSASATSRPCAQVSIKRAVPMDAALIGGPYQGILTPSGTARSAACSWLRVLRHWMSRSAGGIWAVSSAALSTKPSGSAIALGSSSAKTAGSVTASSDCASVQCRCAIW